MRTRKNCLENLIVYDEVEELYNDLLKEGFIGKIIGNSIFKDLEISGEINPFIKEFYKREKDLLNKYPELLKDSKNTKYFKDFMNNTKYTNSIISSIKDFCKGDIKDFDLLTIPAAIKVTSNEFPIFYKENENLFRDMMSKAKQLENEAIEKLNGLIEKVKTEYKSRTIKIIIFVVISILITVISSIVLNKIVIKTGVFNDSLTNKMRNLIGDNDISIYQCNIPMLSGGPNAFNAGGKQLYYTAQLKNIITEPEMIGILAHEYGHYTHKSSALRLTGNFVLGISFYLIMGQVIKLLGINWRKSYLIKIIIFLISIKLGTIASKITVGRADEYWADSYAKVIGYEKQLASGLLKLEDYMRSRMCVIKVSENCDKIMSSITRFDEHPTMIKRIEKLIQTQGSNFEKLTKIMETLRSKFQ